MTVGEEEEPQRGLQHSVKPLVKRSGGEVAAPVVVVTVGVREEVAAQGRQCRPGRGEEAVERAEVVGEGSELSLEEEHVDDGVGEGGEGVEGQEGEEQERCVGAGGGRGGEESVEREEEEKRRRGGWKGRSIKWRRGRGGGGRRKGEILI